MKKIAYIALVTVMASCTMWQPKHREGVAVELNGQSLTFAELDEVTKSVSSEDSAAVADAYVNQWATDILVYAEARDRADEEIERLVEDYRRSLYVHAYEQKLVTRHRPKQWPDSVVERIYAQKKDQLRLPESVLKGVMLIVPKNTPKIEYLKTWMGHLSDANIEKIEKYAFQYATGYEYFPTQWRSINQILMRLPLEDNILEERISHSRQIVLEDSVSVYVLQVTDKRLAGEIMPIEYARGEIEQILLNTWQTTFLKNERKSLYDDAIRFNKLKRYEK